MRELTYRGDSFYMNGKPYTVMSGAMHYFRIPRAYWHDRLLKLKECGFNTVETYVAWNLHEPREGEFDFSGELDVAAFIQTATELDLNVILRPGPFICAEWECGGLPAWLLSYTDMAWRCNDALYLSKAERYLKALFDVVRPFLASKGGNVIMLQVENEYGSYGDDKEYLARLASFYRENGMDCLLFTSDGPTASCLTGGTVEGCLAVANFGSKPEEKLAVLKKHFPDQPVMCGEYWCGWFDHWFEQHHTRTAEEIATDFEGFFRIGASFNFYMFHGGTNFGFMNGANYGKTYAATVTSYDYCAPLNEAGDRTPTYYAVRDVVQKYCGALPAPTATETRKVAYGRVALTEQAKLFDNLERLAAPVHTSTPLYMEKLGQSYGYILYRTQISGPRDEDPLVMEDVRDRAQIFLNGAHKATYCRWAMPTEKELLCFGTSEDETVRLDILCENMGRVNYAGEIRDPKGVQGVRLARQYHFGWDTYCLPMEQLDGLRFLPVEGQAVQEPTFLRGYFEIEGEPADTFIKLPDLHKGFVTINGFHIGRYFNDAGPQKTLFVPAPKLHRGRNEILLFESDAAEGFFVEFVAEPELG